MSSSGYIWAIILIIVGIILIIGGALAYDYGTFSSSSGYWGLIAVGVILIIIGIIVGVYARRGHHDHHHSTTTTHTDVYGNPQHQFMNPYHQYMGGGPGVSGPIQGQYYPVYPSGPSGPSVSSVPSGYPQPSMYASSTAIPIVSGQPVTVG